MIVYYSLILTYIQMRVSTKYIGQQRKLLDLRDRCATEVEELDATKR